METVLVMVTNRANRDLLAEAVGQRYEPVTSGMDEAALEKEFDLGIADGPVLEALGDRIALRKSRDRHFLPFLAVTHREGVSLVTAHLWKSVDDLIVTPVDRMELAARMEILLRARRLSRELERRQASERSLASARAELERLVEERTSELKKANERLKELDMLKNMFIASMSHELRTPLNSIIGFTGVLLRGLAGELTPEQKKHLAIVKDSANHLHALIENVLDIGRIEAGRIDVAPVAFDLKDLAAEVVLMFEELSTSKGITLANLVQESLPMRTDRKLLKQILVNMISNAVKFTDRGNVTVDAEVVRGLVHVRVRDTGVGIPAHRMQDLFQSFSRIVPKDGTHPGGTGLGLYISLKLARLLKGDMTALSEEGKGSVFTVTVPRQL